ncbi:MAG: preprotein translocase subunit SecE [Lachnospiraceae bacterium]|nr:preprotein translocase subunit SecE [Lachnospiraceae bacterium]
MGESNNKENTQKKSFFKGVKSEFKKVIWPTKETLVKETVAVVVTSVILGLIIAIVDIGVKYGFDKLLQLG